VNGYKRGLHLNMVDDSQYFSQAYRIPFKRYKMKHDRSYETFEKRSISFEIKAHEDFNQRNILNISRIEIRMKRRDRAKGGVLQRSPYIFILILLFAAISVMSACSFKKVRMPPLASIEGIPGHFGKGRIIDLEEGKSISFEQLIDQLQSKELIFVGEVHDNPEHHLIQVQILQALMARHGPLTVAMEFFDESRQPVLDRYLEEEVSETLFLKDVDWVKSWSFPYHFYRPIIFLAKEKGRALLGINVPNNIVKKVARSGLDSLTPEERDQVAKEINLDNQAHRDYLSEVFKKHSHHYQLKNFDYFYQAQCVWEETMAENIARYLADNKGKMVVFTGNGHITDKYGVPERVLRRLQVSLATIVLYPLTDQTILNEKMADYIWLTSDSSAGRFMNRARKRPFSAKRTGTFSENQVSDISR